jgi:hypothetical protein
VRVLVLALAILLATPAFGGAAGGADVKAIRALLQEQLTLLKQGKYPQLYALTTKRFRQRCSYPRFARDYRTLRRQLGPTAQVDRIRVDFDTRRRAVVEFRFLKNKKPFVWVRFRAGDLYAKVGRRWYDEYDRIAC